MSGRRAAVTERIEQWRGEGEVEPTLTPHSLVSSIINPRTSGQLKARLPPLLHGPLAPHSGHGTGRLVPIVAFNGKHTPFKEQKSALERFLQRFARVTWVLGTQPRTC